MLDKGTHPIINQKLTVPLNQSLVKFLLSLSTEDYDEERAVSHVRRLLDIVACTFSFGPAPPKDSTSTLTVADVPSATSPTATGSGAKESKKSTAGSNGGGGSRKSSPPPAQKESKEKEVMTDLEAEMSGACPRLGAFYEFFSLANLTPPLHCKFFYSQFSSLSSWKMCSGHCTFCKQQCRCNMRKYIFSRFHVLIVLQDLYYKWET